MKFQFNPNFDFQHEAINTMVELFYVYFDEGHFVLSKKNRT